MATLFRNTLRLRMNITAANISDEMVEAYRTALYPEADVPEVRGLLQVLDSACSRAGVPVRLEAGTRQVNAGLVGFFEPHKIVLPFARARLMLAVAPAEFQWVLQNARKEKGAGAGRVEALQRELLTGTREWVRRGNR